MQSFIEPEVLLFKKDKVIDLSEFVQGSVVSKSLRNPAPVFNITFNPSLSTKGGITINTNRIFNQLNKQLGLNDIIAGKLDRRSKNYSFLGFISNPYESKTNLNNQTSRSLMVDGSFLLPKLLLRDMIVNAPELATMPEITGDPVLGERAKFFAWTRGIKENGTVFVNTPQKIVEWILDEAVATNTKVSINKTAKSLFPGPKNGIKDKDGNPLLNFKFLDGEFIYGETLSTFTGPLINYIYECLDRDFYELFFDTVTGEDGLPYNTMTIRTKPFTHKEIDQSSFFTNWSYWEDLPTVKLDTWTRLNVGKSDYELKNFFRVNYRKVLMAQTLGRFGLNFPILNLHSIKKFGLRPLEVNSTIMADLSQLVDNHNNLFENDEAELPGSLAENKDTGLISGLLEKRDKIKEWFAFPFFESGSITTMLNEDITIGKRLELPQHLYYFPQDDKIYKGCKFYIDTVRHTFQWGSFAKTDITVTRGHPDGVVKAWFDHPDQQFTISPLEKSTMKIKISSDGKAFFEKVANVKTEILDIYEVPDE